MQMLRSTKILPLERQEQMSSIQKSPSLSQISFQPNVREKSFLGRSWEYCKLCLVIFLPITSLITISSITVLSLVSVSKATRNTINMMEQSYHVSTAVQNLQKERGLSVMFISSLGANLQSYKDFLELSNDTNKKIIEIVWPSNGLQVETGFETKQQFIASLQKTRRDVSLISKSVNDIISFYSKITSGLMEFAVARMSFTTDLQKKIISNNLLMEIADVVGIMQALGLSFFNECKLSPANLIYFSQLEGIEERLKKMAFIFDDSIRALFEKKLSREIFASFENKTSLFWNDTVKSVCETQSQNAKFKNSISWFSNVSVYIDTFFEIRNFSTIKINDTLNSVLANAETKMSIYITIEVLITCVTIAILTWYIYCIEKFNRKLRVHENHIGEKIQELQLAKKKSDTLMYQMIPKKIALQLQEEGIAKAEEFREVSVFFSDIVGFTDICNNKEPMGVVDMLDDIYNIFDDCIDHFDVYKVETIGDAYMVASGVPIPNGQQHAFEIASMSLAVRRSIIEFETGFLNQFLKLRIGINSGPCVAGVVGRKMPRYCLFGDTVNTASRMESTSESGKIHISEDTKNILENFNQFSIFPRGSLSIKGKGKMKTYWLEE